MATFPTPLIVFQSRKGGRITETSRVRADQEHGEFWAMMALHIVAASMDDPDEVIVRIMRPVQE